MSEPHTSSRCTAGLTLSLAFSLALLALSFAAGFTGAQERPIVLKASTVLDGQGKILRNTVIVVEGGKISRVGGSAPPGAVRYDLSRL
ncbi:MAG TPA: hypothetical protein VF740_00385, partial [Candidatus Acidoferrum sp.]